MGRCGCCPGDLEEEMFGVAPSPVLARLVGADQRMAGLVPARYGVPVGGAVATAGVSAGHALAQVKSLPIGAQALLPAAARRRHVSGRVQVDTYLSHGTLASG